MPLARIDLVQGKSAEYRRTIGDVVYEAIVEHLKAPKDDRFQVIAEHARTAFPTRALLASTSSRLLTDIFARRAGARPRTQRIRGKQLQPLCA